MSTEPTTATHRVTWNGDVPTFTCGGDRTSNCHIFPDCDCETWYEGHNEDHPFVAHDTECWQLGWLKVDDGLSSFEHEDGESGYEVPPPHIDGFIDTTWEGDYLSWTYPVADVAAVQS